MTMMTDSKAADVLAAHNEWRRGGDGPQTEPVTLGLALDQAIARLREPAGVGGECPRCAGPGFRNAKCPSCGEGPWAAPQPPAEAQAQGGGDVCETCDGAGHVVTYADPYDRGDVSSPEQSPCPACTTPPSGGLCVERTCDLDFPQWDAVKRLIEPAPPSAPVGVEEVFNLVRACESAVRRLGWRSNDYSLGHEARMLAQGYENGAFQSARETLRALAQQPAAVDGAMVERALAEWKRLEGHQTDAVRMSAALQEALAAQPGGSDNGR